MPDDMNFGKIEAKTLISEIGLIKCIKNEGINSIFQIKK